MRQNKAEIGDIEFAEQLEVVELPAPEMAYVLAVLLVTAVS